jgi:hypothetical protein
MPNPAAAMRVMHEREVEALRADGLGLGLGSGKSWGGLADQGYHVYPNP